jgi:hypothetical protein
MAHSGVVVGSSNKRGVAERHPPNTTVRRWRIVRFKAAAIVAVTLLLWGNGVSQAEQITQDAIQQVAENLPVLSPDIIWEQQLPGLRRAEPRNPNVSVDNELAGAIQLLSGGWSPTGNQTDWTGSPAGLVTHLSPPGETPRAIFWLTDGHLYLVEKSQAGWQTRRLTDAYADVSAVVDLSGDGQPEIVVSTQYGSGAILSLQVIAWDNQRVWTAFSHTGAQEPGRFGWFDAEGDGRRELWIDTSVARGLFTGTAHGPFMRDRLIFRWDHGTYRQIGRYRFATPLYHLNRYLYFTSKGDWKSATRHTEPGAKIDRTLATALGLGPFSGGSDVPFVNGRMYFGKDGRNYFADFGGTGRLVGLGTGRAQSRR